ncbi:flagellin [Anaerobiospirillum succiniciproducens]|uniref:flagellin N-terminal helical domain-containing protein n=1 Tax=Anaerobiospirillum succiniciproducens TaxID=13335 RepID=UPI002352C040|nr:flagellin [Anaerobiospirillum succiniciproducens]MCI6863143.1 flagellin [Anaerobiospirillum succiniciproducens]
MALYVNTNVSSINAQRKLANSTLALNTSYQRLSSGLRINSSKDDAAGLQISDRLTAQINGLNQGNRNSNDGIALCQTIEGALDETTNMLQRIRTLAVQSANGTNTNKDRKALQEEVSALSHEITRIAQKSTFAGAQILDGGKNVTDPIMRKIGQTDNYEYFFQVGANADDEITLQCGAFTMKGIATAAGIHNLKAMSDNQNINDKLTKAGLVTSNGQLVWAVDTPEIAQKTLNYVDKFIELVDSKRAALGAIQNRMESTIRNQSSISENESDARSRIRDTDFASETAALTSNQIIQQASQTILTQANQRPTIALQLLGQ